MDANALRRAFVDFFASRGHRPVASASLVPHDPSVLFTIAGMVPFKPWFLGEEPAPYPRAVSVQKCFRTLDIEVVGTTARHCTFFEMLGNFSFGDYFKELAIPMAWELVTEVLGIDAERLWVTVHFSDDEAAEIWRTAVGVPSERIQRMGEDNFWQMGETGPCGPCSEIYFDKGARYGEAGGPAEGGPERFVEIWNLVFMQFNRSADGQLTELPRKNIDTGAGLERLLPILQGTDSIFATDVFLPVLEAAEAATGTRYGVDETADRALRVLADHGRAMTFLVADGVLPANDGRGYVLRRIVRRAVLRAHQLGAPAAVTPRLVEAVSEVMGEAYPDLARQRGFVEGVLAGEEERFARTLRAGLRLLEDELDALGEQGSAVLSGESAFRLHDTHGFPVDLTREIAAEREAGVDEAGFRSLMEAQRDRARRAGKEAAAEAGAEVRSARAVLEHFGPTTFLGYEEATSEATVLAVEAVEGRTGLVEVYLDRTPFYAEGGGQLGDTGTIVAEGVRLEVLDTKAPLGGVVRHLARPIEGELRPGQSVTAAIDVARRERLRRNHTATHLLHWALRTVLGEHVRQQGSLVAPDRLRFDFSHFEAPSSEELERVMRLVTEEVVSDLPVRTYETSKSEAERLGVLAFFGDRYGERVRVVEAGSGSRELCGGTHVGAVGMIGPVVVVSEGSIGSSTRRIEAVTGVAALERYLHQRALLDELGGLLRSGPEELTGALSRLLVRQRELEDELRRAEQARLSSLADELLRSEVDGVVVARVDRLGAEQLRELATMVRAHEGIRAVILGGSPDGSRVALVSAVAPGSGLVASDLVAPAARLVGGGAGRAPDLAVAGGRDASRLDDALELARSVTAGAQPAEP